MTEPTAPASSRHPAVAALGWAAFLACSWTWCIGMFLPVLLVRDYGSWAWVVFALPNVAGAAAMGWVLQRDESSRALVERHAGAMAAFSVVTILFHVLFVAWIVRWLGGMTPLAGASGNDWPIYAAVAGAAVVLAPLLLSRRVTLWLSVLVWLGSMSAFVTAAWAYGKIPPMPDPSALANSAPMSDLAPLAAVCVLGFVLCPYLDLTFHRARQGTSMFGAVAAFTIGFGALFLANIVFTLWYAPLVVPPEVGPGFKALPAAVTLAIVLHLAGQTGFTTAAHGVDLARRFAGVTGPAARRGALAGLLFGGAILGFAWWLNDRGGYQPRFGPPSARHLSGAELGYRLFMAFYGLIGPAYVWTIMMPWRGGSASIKARGIACAAAILLAAPAYWMGFIEQKMLWLAAGVLIVLAARPAVEVLGKMLK